MTMRHRKDKPIGQTFDASFSWGGALDAIADVYNGVRQGLKHFLDNADPYVVCFLVNVNLPGPRCLVYVEQYLPLIVTFANIYRLPSLAYGYIWLRNLGNDISFTIFPRHSSISPLCSQKSAFISLAGSLWASGVSGQTSCIQIVYSGFRDSDDMSCLDCYVVF